MKGKLYFNETQTMSGSIIWYLTLAFSVGMCGLFVRGMYLQLITNEPWGDRPMSDLGLVLISLGSILLIVGVLVFISLHRLTLQVDQEAIYVQFKPYFNSFKTFRKADIQKVFVRKYRPILEYGGWGLRIGLKNSKAYNISGNQGLQLVFSDGSKLLVGTKREKELAAAIEKFNADG